ncbi:MAG: WD40-repeat-containing domain protein [Benjaminiella poitrasii]|nr:MAG: WD40-repeat-containing domain protein [Benjaminiella poitrasii]
MNNGQGGSVTQTSPNINATASPNTVMSAENGSPEGTDKKKNIAVALYQRRQVHHVMQQQQQQAQQQQQQQGGSAQTTPQTPHHAQKRQRTNNGGNNSVTTPQQAPPSPQLKHKVSPRTAQQQNPSDSPVMTMPQRLAASSQQQQQQQRNQFEQQQQQQMNSPQMTRNSISGTPQQQHRQSQQQQGMPWNSMANDMGSPMNNDVQASPAVMNNPSSMAAAATTNVNTSGNGNNNNNSNVLSFDLERFMMGDGGDFGEMFASGDDGTDPNLLMGGDNGDLDSFGGSFLASMGGGLDLENAMLATNGPGGSSGQGLMGGMGGHGQQQTSMHPYAELSGHTNKVSTTAFSSDGQWLASAGHDRKVMIWNVQDKKMVYSLDGHTSNITCARWSNDSRHLLATSSYDKTLRVWDVGTALTANAAGSDKEGGSSGKEDEGEKENATVIPKQLLKFDCHAQVTAVDFAPGRPNTICSLDAEGELNVWDLTTGACEKSIKMTQSKSGFSPNPMRFHPKNAAILVCAVGNQIFIVDLALAKTGSTNGIRTITTDHSKNVCAFDWSADGALLVASSEDKVCVYESAHWKCVASQIPQSKVSGCAFVKIAGREKPSLLFGGYQDIFLWELGVPGAQPQQAGFQPGMIVSIACSPGSNTPALVATASHHQKEKNLILWTI